MAHGIRRIAAAAAWVALAAAASDDRLLPPKNLVDTKTVNDHLLGASLPPGGIMGNYRDAQGAYQLFLLRLPTNEKAAFLLLDIKKQMADPHYLPNMGGFAGRKGSDPFYVFAKGPFVAAVKGRPEAQADPIARIFAARLPLR